MGVPILKSKDGGKTFKSISRENVHSDHQALWINPKRQGHLINGNDGGLNMSYDDGASWTKLNVSLRQFYAIHADNQQPYHVYKDYKTTEFGRQFTMQESTSLGINQEKIPTQQLWAEMECKSK